VQNYKIPYGFSSDKAGWGGEQAEGRGSAVFWYGWEEGVVRRVQAEYNSPHIETFRLISHHSSLQGVGQKKGPKRGVKGANTLETLFQFWPSVRVGETGGGGNRGRKKKKPKTKVKTK